EPPRRGAGSSVGRERGQVGVEFGILRRQVGLHLALPLGRDPVPCAPGVVTGSHRRSLRGVLDGVASGKEAPRPSYSSCTSAHPKVISVVRGSPGKGRASAGPDG